MRTFKVRSDHNLIISSLKDENIFPLYLLVCSFCHCYQFIDHKKCHTQSATFLLFMWEFSIYFMINFCFYCRRITKNHVFSYYTRLLSDKLEQKFKIKQYCHQSHYIYSIYFFHYSYYIYFNHFDRSTICSFFLYISIINLSKWNFSIKVLQ